MTVLIQQERAMHQFGGLDCIAVAAVGLVAQVVAFDTFTAAQTKCPQRVKKVLCTQMTLRNCSDLAQESLRVMRFTYRLIMQCIIPSSARRSGLLQWQCEGLSEQR